MKLIYAMIAMTILSSFAMACHGINRECQAYGYDYGIAKFECGNNNPADSDGTPVAAQWYYNLEKECSSIDWKSAAEVTAVLSKEGNDYFIHTGGMSGNIAQTGQHSISHITLCGKEPDEEVPEFGLVGTLLATAGVLTFVVIKRR